MKISYEKLWKLLKENKMKKSDFAKAIHASQYTMSKLKNNQPVHLSIIMNICKVFHCEAEEIIELIEE